MTILYPFPVLHSESLDYRDPRAYRAEPQRTGRAAVVIDHVLRANTLVGRLVQQRAATFFATVSVRGTVFRDTRITASDSLHASGNKFSAKQTIPLPEFSWAPELFVHAGVLLLRSVTLTENQVSDEIKQGLSDFYGNTSIHFPSHSRIAFIDWKRFFSMSALFKIQSDITYKNGHFQSETIRSSPIQISVTMSPQLFDEIEADHDSTARAHILCSALTQTFQELHHAQKAGQSDLLDQRDDADVQFLEQADGLKVYLESRGIPTWEDEQFNPTYSASRLYQASLVESADTEEEYGE